MPITRRFRQLHPARHLLLLTIVPVSLASCKEDAGPSQHRVSREDRPVASVIKRSGDGKVLARRAQIGGENRELGVGSQLFGDDVITTEGTGSIEARLFQNQVTVVISKARERRLADTAAWKAAAEGSGPRQFIDTDNTDHTPKPPPAPVKAPPPGPAAQPVPPKGPTP
jgi:hypothetical protein